MVIEKQGSKGKVTGAGILLAILALGAAGIIAPVAFYTTKTIYDLLGENKELKKNITHLTAESQIGYAKVLSQETREGKLFTRILFVETDRADPLTRVLEKEFEIEGDVIHFDALVVKFDYRVVMDGTERAMYLWRRVYGEHTSPDAGFPIEAHGAEPKRYADICDRLSLQDRQMFWAEIWNLANDPTRLADAGVKAIYGNVIYRQLRPGLIYVFKISNTGALYPEVIPDL